MPRAEDIRKALKEYVSKRSVELTEYLYGARQRLAELEQKEPEVANALKVILKNLGDGVTYENSEERARAREDAMTSYDNFDEMGEMAETVEAVFKKYGIEPSGPGSIEELLENARVFVENAAVEVKKNGERIDYKAPQPAAPSKGKDAPIEDVMLHMFYENPDRAVTSADVARFYSKTLHYPMTEATARDRLRKYIAKGSPHISAKKEGLKGAVQRWTVAYAKDGSARPVQRDGGTVVERKWKNKSISSRDFSMQYGVQLAMEACEKNPDTEFDADSFLAYLKEVGVTLTGTKDPRRSLKDFLRDKLPDAAGAERLEFGKSTVMSGGAPKSTFKLKGEKCVRAGRYEVSEDFLNAAKQYLDEGLVIEDWEVLASIRAVTPMTAEQLEEAKSEVITYLESKGTQAETDGKGRITAQKK